MALSESNFNADNNSELMRDCLVMVPHLIDRRAKDDCPPNLNRYTKFLQTNFSVEITSELLDDFLYSVAENLWPHVMTCTTDSNSKG